MSELGESPFRHDTDRPFLLSSPSPLAFWRQREERRTRKGKKKEEERDKLKPACSSLLLFRPKESLISLSRPRFPHFCLMSFARNFVGEKEKKKIWERGGRKVCHFALCSVKRKIPLSPSEPWVFRGGERRGERGGWLKLSFLLALYLSALRRRRRGKRRRRDGGSRVPSHLSFPLLLRFPPPLLPPFLIFFFFRGNVCMCGRKRGGGRKKEKRTKLPVKEEDEFANLEICHTLKLGEEGRQYSYTLASGIKHTCLQSWQKHFLKKFLVRLRRRERKKYGIPLPFPSF